MLNREAELLEYFRRLRLRVNAILNDFVVELAALDILRHQVNPSQRLYDLKQPDDERMLDRLERRHFARKHPQVLRVES